MFKNELCSFWEQFFFAVLNLEIPKIKKNDGYFFRNSNKTSR